MAHRFAQIIQRIDQRPVKIPKNEFFHTSKLHLFAHTANRVILIPFLRCLIALSFRQSVRSHSRLYAVYRIPSVDTGLPEVGVRRRSAKYEV